MPSIIDELIEHVLSWKASERVADVRIGLGYTAVKLSSGKCGMACMLRHRLAHDSCSLLSQAGTLIETKASHLVPLLASQSVVEASKSKIPKVDRDRIQRTMEKPAMLDRNLVIIAVIAIITGLTVGYFLSLYLL